MKKTSRLLSRTVAWLIALVLTVGALTPTLPTVRAANVTKVQKSYEIAVVFDNSGSMYKNKAWSQAKYAMEIFASMLNYDTDKLTIFTMWPVTTDKTFPVEDGNFKLNDPSKCKIEIASREDIDKISNLYTVRASETPYAPIDEAYSHLAASQATDKWLLILTDGAFNQNARGESASIDLQADLTALASSASQMGIYMQYLGFGGATALKGNKTNFFSQKSSAAQLKTDLIEICNRIFQRKELKSRLSGKTLTLDLSMKNLIVFAQGKNATITSLTDASGKEVKITLNSGQRKYSTIRAGNYKTAEVDDSLAGQVVTFAACPKGTYTLNYSGTEAIQLFYEPDVDIQVTLTNSDGVEVNGSSGELPVGEYTVHSRIVDNATGEDVTKHKLMGDVSLTTKIKQSGDKDYTNYKNGATITLNEDSETDILVEGTYLKDYKITSAGNPDLDWLRRIKVVVPTAKLEMSAEVLQEGKWYLTSEPDGWQPVKASLTLDGQPLSAEQMGNVQFAVNPSRELPYRCEAVPGESSYLIYVGQNEAGEFTEPEHGGYRLDLEATYTEPGLAVEPAAGKAHFEVQPYSQWIRTLIILAIILAILLLIALWLLHPVLPKRIVLVGDGFVRNAQVKGNTNVPGRWDLNAVPLGGKAEKVMDMRNSWIMSKLKPKRQNFKLKELRSAKVRDFTMDGIRYSMNNGVLYDDMGEKVTSLKISNASVSWREEKTGNYFEGEIRINRR